MTTLTSRAEFRVHSDTALLAFWRREMEEHGFDHWAVDGNTIAIHTPFGSASIHTHDGRARIDIQCNTVDDLIGVREAISHHLIEFDPRLSTVGWDQGSVHAPALPNFSEAQVDRIDRLNACYWRVRLALPDAIRFEGPGQHFRLLRQRNARRPAVWPTLGPRGIPHWPDAEDELIQTHYTVRAVDASRGHLHADVFEHPGGGTGQWLATDPLGQTVGLLGPGGGSVPSSGWLLLGGDETAVPALVRSLESLPASTEGIAFLVAPTKAAIQAIDSPSRVDVRWLCRDRGASLVAAVTAVDLAPYPDAALWFAASYEESRAVRCHFRERVGLDRRRLTVVAFW